MKHTTIIDPTQEEEIVIHARARTREIEALEAYVEQMGKELVGYGEGGEIVLLRPDGVCCFTAEAGRVYALTEGEKLAVRLPLYALEEALGEGFVRINQSCLGNVRRISRFDASIGGSLMVTFQNGHKDYVSRRQLKNVKERMGMKK